jgi:hypothetical protein
MDSDRAEAGHQRIESCGEGLAFPWDGVLKQLLGSLVMMGALMAAPPNVVLIVTDDQGYPDLGCLGSKPLQTPHLDRLAAEGVRATNFYVTWPACTPSRGSLLTRRYPQRNGLYNMVRNDLVNYGHRYTAEEYAVSPEMTLGLDPQGWLAARKLTARKLLLRGAGRVGARRRAGTGCEGVCSITPSPKG